VWTITEALPPIRKRDGVRLIDHDAHHVDLLNGSADLRSHPNHVGPHLGILGARIISQIDSHRPGEEDSGQNNGYRKDSAEYSSQRSFRIHETAKKISQIAQAIATNRPG
jgi:hypothetical protein